jgi:hypothetical protein
MQNLHSKKQFFKIIIVLFMTSCWLNQSFGQAYTRKSLTILITEFADNQPIPNSYFNYLTVSDRHDFNNIGTKTIDPGISFVNADSYTEEQLSRKIYADRIPNRILESILIDKSTRAMTIANVQERGLYNASDNEMAAARNSARGFDILKDAGVKLLGNIYFVVIKPTSYSTSYNSTTKGNDQTVSGVSYLYQLNLDSAYMAGKFWDDFYFDKPNTTMYNKLMNYDFPLKYTTRAFNVTVSDLDAANKAISGLQMFGNMLANKSATVDESTLTRKTQGQMNQEMMQKVLGQSLGSIESQDDFLVRSSVYKSHPLLSKIGKKESVYTDQLFEVTENVIDARTNARKEKHVGFIRAKRVADNRTRTNGVSEPSSFYRIASGPISKGMQLKDYSAYDSRWTIGASYNTDSASVLSGYFLNFEWMTHGLPGLNLGVDVGYNPSLVTETLDGSPNQHLRGEDLVATLTLRQSLSYHRLVITPTFGVLGGYSFVESGDVNVSYGTGSAKKTERLTASSLTDHFKQVGGYMFGYLYGGDVGINLGRTLQIRGGIRFSDVANITYNSAKDASYEFPSYEATYKKQIFTFGIRFGRL